jgi:hypothetical protein
MRTHGAIRGGHNRHVKKIFKSAERPAERPVLTGPLEPRIIIKLPNVSTPTSEQSVIKVLNYQ